MLELPSSLSQLLEESLSRETPANIPLWYLHFTTSSNAKFECIPRDAPYLKLASVVFLTRIILRVFIEAMSSYPLWGLTMWTSTDGVRTEFDAIILAIGFDVQQFIAPMEIYGKSGRSLAMARIPWCAGLHGRLRAQFPQHGYLVCNILILALALLICRVKGMS
ncbi:hypothetical protein BDV35DRAFT_388279 [Aspergillus flavus]|uniref:Uncharacterized protein n=2 Tax=Aspergillus subgen. Circumdati TaxID=2720871 RepID=A0A5N6HBX2_ASPFL|nr:hypothetical protein BDV35DRAFT_388279 [Aspergillus flavus]GMF67116.1 unnamed protein product [Aspergillus oryzae]GMF83281.1 unnamed protein product [Aspergillus oryzae]GMG41709.1 unnamed protein product [Aspergillus oryzae var. brunneus]